MKNKVTITILTTAVFLGFNSVAQKTNNLEQDSVYQIMENFEISPKTAHPNACKLLKDDFYWSPIEESGPFGNDDGFDVFYKFKEWRLINKKVDPILFLEELFTKWNLPKFDLYSLDTVKIEKYISGKESGESKFSKPSPEAIAFFRSLAEDAGKEFDEEEFIKVYSSAPTEMGDRYLLSYDNAIIAVTFGQLILEGRIDEDLIELCKIVIQRELLPIMLENWGENYRNKRIDQLKKMYKVLEEVR